MAPVKMPLWGDPERVQRDQTVQALRDTAGLDLYKLAWYELLISLRIPEIVVWLATLIERVRWWLNHR